MSREMCFSFLILCQLVKNERERGQKNECIYQKDGLDILD